MGLCYQYGCSSNLNVDVENSLYMEQFLEHFLGIRYIEYFRSNMNDVHGDKPSQFWYCFSKPRDSYFLFVMSHPPLKYIGKNWG